MADDLKKSTEPAPNSDAIGATIRAAFETIFALENQIDEAREKHVLPLTTKRTTAWRVVKKDTNINRRVIELQYKQYRMARLAAEDEEENTTIEDMKAVFNAMHPGGELDWVTATSPLPLPT